MKSLSRTQQAIFLSIVAIVIVSFFVMLDLRSEYRIVVFPAQESYGVSRITPQERVSGSDILGEPVYFEIEAPSVYGKAVVRPVYTAREVPVMDIGYVQGTGVTFRNVMHQALNNNSSLVVEPHLARSYGGVGVYGVSLPLQLPVYAPPTRQVVKVPFVSPVTLEVVIRGTPLDIQCDACRIIFEGNDFASRLYRDDLADGVYVVTLHDAETFVTTNPYWSFRSPVVTRTTFKGTLAMPFMKVTAYTPEGTQEMMIDGKSFVLGAVFDYMPVSNEHAVHEVIIPPGVQIAGQGRIIPVGVRAYQVEPYSLYGVSTIPKDITQIVIDDHNNQEVSFDLDVTTRTHRFVVSLPNMPQGGGVKLDRVEVTFLEQQGLSHYVRVWIQELQKRFR